MSNLGPLTGTNGIKKGTTIKVYSDVPNGCQEAAQAVQNYDCNLQMLLQQKTLGSKLHQDDGGSDKERSIMLAICDETYLYAAKSLECFDDILKQSWGEEITEDYDTNTKEQFLQRIRSDLKALRQRQVEFEHNFNLQQQQQQPSSSPPLLSFSKNITSGFATMAWGTVRGASCAVTSAATGVTSGAVTGGLVGGFVGGVQGAIVGVTQGSVIVAKGAVSGMSQIVARAVVDPKNNSITTSTSSSYSDAPTSSSHDQ